MSKRLVEDARRLRDARASQEREESALLPPVVHPRPKRRKRAKKTGARLKGKPLADLPKRKLIVELRVAGKPTSEIAEMVGLSPGMVGAHLRDWVLSQTPPDEATEELRRIMLERLERMHDLHWRAAMGVQEADGSWRLPPSRDAGEFLLKIMDREAKLMGVDLQPSTQTLLISAESIARYLGWDPGENSAIVDVEASEIRELSVPQ